MTAVRGANGAVPAVSRYSVTCLPSIIPEPDCGIGQIMFVAERAHACYVEHEKPCGSRLEAQPTRSEHTQEMSARKNQYIGVERADTRNNTIGTRANLFRRFSVRATIAKQFPIRSCGVDLCRSQTFVVAVVPFDQITIDFSYGSKARQFTSSKSALQWAGQDSREIGFSQAVPKTQRIAFTARRQRQIRQACV